MRTAALAIASLFSLAFASQCFAQAAPAVVAGTKHLPARHRAPAAAQSAAFAHAASVVSLAMASSLPHTARSPARTSIFREPQIARAGRRNMERPFSISVLVT